MLIHFSKNKIETLEYVKQVKICFKPDGLWYGKNDDWIKYYTKNINKINDFKYIYECKLYYTSIDHHDKNKVLRINNKSSFDAFTLKYGVSRKNKFFKNSFYILIDWVKVAKHYGGIQIMPLIKSRMIGVNKKMAIEYNNKFKLVKNTDADRLSLYFWQLALDIPSGCIWNPKAIRKFVRIYTI
jgi:hypothetical protein